MHQFIHSWVEDRLHQAKTDLVMHGVPAVALKASAKVQWTQITRAFIYTGRQYVYAAIWWAMICKVLGWEERYEELMRHELAHLLVVDYPKVAKAFDLPDYPSTFDLYRQYALIVLGRIQYRDVTPEEEFATAVGELNPKVLRKLSKLLQ